MIRLLLSNSIIVINFCYFIKSYTHPIASSVIVFFLNIRGTLFFPRRVARVKVRFLCGHPVTVVDTPTRATAMATRTAFSRCRYQAQHKVATSLGISRSVARPWHPRIHRVHPATTKASLPWTWMPSCALITSARWNTQGHLLQRH